MARAGVGEGPEVDGAEDVERPALRGRIEKRLLGVLPVEVDQPGPGLGQGRDRRHAPVDPGPGPSLGGHGPGQDDLLVVDDEPALRPGPGLAPGRTRTGSARPPTSSSRASTSSVLPAPVSPVRAVMPGPSSSVTASMTPRSRTRSSTSIGGDGSAQRSARWNRDRRMAWKSRSPKRDQAGVHGPSRHTTASPGYEGATLMPVDDEDGRQRARPPRGGATARARGRGCGRTACAARSASPRWRAAAG